MSALKKLLKSDTPTSDTTTERSGGLRGQGSHFPSNETSSQPSAVTGADSLSTDRTAGRLGAGPEAAGSDHIGTTSGGNSDPTDPPTYEHPEVGAHSSHGTGNTGATSSAATTAASRAWESRSERMPGGSQDSSNYENPYKASRPLDPRVDGGKLGSTSSTTAGAQDRPSYTPSGTASTSADRGSGVRAGVADNGLGAGATGFAGRGQDTSETAAPMSSTGSSAGMSKTAPAPSTLTSTANPTDRSDTYAGATSSKGIDPSVGSTLPAATPATPTTYANPENTQEQQGVAGKVLGALGLGGAAAALGYGSKSEAPTEPRDTSAISTQPGRSSQETGPPKHYRRESIPTTAYPAGPSSPRPVAAPIGGTGADRRDSSGTSALPSSRDTGVSTLPSQTSSVPTQSTVHDLITVSSSESHTGRNVALGASTGVAAAAGASALDQHDKHDPIPSTIGTSQPSPSYTAGIAPSTGMTGSSRTAATPTTGHTYTIGNQPRNDAGSTPLPDRTRDSPIDAVAKAPGRYNDQDAQPTQATSALGAHLNQREDHTGRNTTLAGAAMTGGAAYADHDRSREHAPTHAAEQSRPLNQQEYDTGRNTALGVGSGAAVIGGDAQDRPREHEPTRALEQSRTPNQPDYHTGRTAALGTGAGASNIGGAAYAQDRSHEHEPTRAADQTRTLNQQEYHTGRNAALGAGVGAATIGGVAYAQDRPREHEPTRALEQSRTSNQPEYHTGRTAALGAGAGGAVLGGAAYGQDRSREEEARRAAEYEKELLKQRENHEKEMAKQRHADEKAAEKEAHKHAKEIERQEHERQKQLEKERKHQAKEQEKEAKERQAALAAAEQRDHARLLAEEEDRKRREREAAVPVTDPTNTFAGQGMTKDEGQHGSYKPEESRATHEAEHKEKKPSILRRIFRKRANKDTGLEEEYSTDEEDTAAHHHGAVPTHHSDSKGRNVLGAAPTTTEHGQRESTTGLLYDPAKDPEAAHRLSREPDTSDAYGHGRGMDNAPLGGTSTTAVGTSVTGAAGSSAVDGQHSSSAPVGDTTGIHETGHHGLPASATDGHFGEIGDHRR